MAQPTVVSRPATWAGTSNPIVYKFTSTNYSNAGYRMQVEIWDATAAAKIADAKYYANSSGALIVDVSAFLRSNLSTDNEADLTTGTIYEDVNWIKYYIKYQEVWTSSSETQVNDSANPRWAINGGVQLGDANDFTNLLGYTTIFSETFDSDLGIFSNSGIGTSWVWQASDYAFADLTGAAAQSKLLTTSLSIKANRAYKVTYIFNNNSVNNTLVEFYCGAKKVGEQTVTGIASTFITSTFTFSTTESAASFSIRATSVTASCLFIVTSIKLEYAPEFLTDIERGTGIEGYNFLIGFIGHQNAYIRAVRYLNSVLVDTTDTHITFYGAGMFRLKQADEAADKYRLSIVDKSTALDILDNWLNGSTGTSWTLDSNPDVTLTSAATSKVIYTDFTPVSDLDYAFDYDIDAGINANSTIRIGFYDSSFNALDYEDFTGYGNLTGTKTLTGVPGAVYLGLRITASPTLSQFLLNSSFTSNFDNWSNSGSGVVWGWIPGDVAISAIDSTGSQDMVQTFAIKTAGNYQCVFRCYNAQAGKTINFVVRLYNGATFVQELLNFNCTWQVADIDSNIQDTGTVAVTGDFDTILIYADKVAGADPVTAGVGSVTLTQVNNVYNINSMAFDDTDYPLTISETKTINILEDCKNIVMLQWRNSQGGPECYPFTYTQEYTWDYSGGKKAKRLTLFANNLTLNQWEAIQGLNTLGELYRTNITEMTTSLNRTSATIGQSVYVLNADGTKTGVNVIGQANSTMTKQQTHSAYVTIEYPELFLQ